MFRGVRKYPNAVAQIRGSPRCCCVRSHRSTAAPFNDFMILRLRDWLDGLDGLVCFASPVGKILACGEKNWRALATENGVPELADPSVVIGANIVDFIRGEDVRRAYRGVVDALIGGNAHAVRFLARCDAPAMPGEHGVTITAVRSGRKLHGFLFQVTPLRTSVTMPRLTFDFSTALSAARANGGHRLAICSFCKKTAPANANLKDPAAWAELQTRMRQSALRTENIQQGVCPSCRRKWANELLPRGSGKPLTTRQIEILLRVIRGDSNKVIAHRLEMAENTVKTHLKEIFRRIGAKNRAEATRLTFKIWPQFRED